MRYPGVILGTDEASFPPLLRLVAAQLKVGEECWSEYRCRCVRTALRLAAWAPSSRSYGHRQAGSDRDQPNGPFPDEPEAWVPSNMVPFA